MTENEAYQEFLKIRWPETNGEPVCPKCGSWQYRKIRTRSLFRCKACNKQFSAVSGTKFHSRKLPYSVLLAAMRQANVGEATTTIASTLHIQGKSSWAIAKKQQQGDDMTAGFRTYQSRPTGNLMHVGMNQLTDLVVRPGMRKFLWPLCLYRGAMSPGHAHRLWNYALLMMAAEAETLADGMKMAHNPAFVQLCGPVSRPQKITMFSFFGRLWNSPDVTDNIPGFTEYVRSLGLGPSWLTPVARETNEQYCAPWRVSTHPDFDPKAEKPESGIRNLYYPYLVHDPKKSDGHEVVLLANEIVSKQLPAQVRADACQDLAVAILSGEIRPEDAYDWVNRYVRDVFKMHPTKFDQGGPIVSFDQPDFRHSNDPSPRTDRI